MYRVILVTQVSHANAVERKECRSFVMVDENGRITNQSWVDVDLNQDEKLLPSMITLLISLFSRFVPLLPIEPRSSLPDSTPRLYHTEGHVSDPQNIRIILVGTQEARLIEALHFSIERHRRSFRHRCGWHRREGGATAVKAGLQKIKTTCDT